MGHAAWQNQYWKSSMKNSCKFSYKYSLERFIFPRKKFWPYHVFTLGYPQLTCTINYCQ